MLKFRNLIEFKLFNFVSRLQNDPKIRAEFEHRKRYIRGNVKKNPVYLLTLFHIKPIIENVRGNVQKKNIKVLKPKIL